VSRVVLRYTQAVKSSVKERIVYAFVELEMALFGVDCLEGPVDDCAFDQAPEKRKVLLSSEGD